VLKALVLKALVLKALVLKAHFYLESRLKSIERQSFSTAEWVCGTS